MRNAIDCDAERKRFEAWFAEKFLDGSFLAPSTSQHVADTKVNAWRAWLAAMTYGRQDAQPADDSDTIEVRIPVAVSDENELCARRYDRDNLNSDIGDVESFFDVSQVYIITARIPKYRIPEIAADKVEPADTGEAT